MLMGLLTFFIGLLADVVRNGQQINEEVLYRLRAQQMGDEAWQRNITDRLSALEQQLADADVLTRDDALERMVASSSQQRPDT
jgi:hypothetical protein